MSSQTEVKITDKITVGGEAAKFSQGALLVGVLCLGGAVALGSNDLDKLQHAYLVAFMYVLSVGLGALWFVAIQHLTSAKWSVVVRRIAEVLANNMWVIALMSLGVVVPMLSGSTTLYNWLDHDLAEHDHLLHHKLPYLNITFFTIRWVVYFAVWIWLSRMFLSQSLLQDKGKGKGTEVLERLRRVSAPGMILFTLTMTFASFDFLMSLDYTWFSTMFGVYYFAGCVLGGYSTLALALMWLQGQGRMTSVVTADHYHDIGKMMFAFVVFWAYIGFSQFMLIWYADIPEETHWYLWRFTGDWRIVSAVLLAAHFVIPLFGLISRHVKRNKKALGFWAVWILVVHYLDLFWLVYPNGGEEVPLGAIDILCWLGLSGIFVGIAARRLRGISLVPTGDPRLADSLAFHNV